MVYSLNNKIELEIIALAKKYDINSVILFGSRARMDNRNNSDIDLALSGGNIVGFKSDLDEAVNTLLFFDVVNLDEPVQDELLNSIKREGIVIYEKV